MTSQFSKPPSLSRDPNAMDIDATRKKGVNPVLCFQCDKLGHIGRDCPHRFDVCYMLIDECSDFAQQIFANLDAQVGETVEPPEDDKEVTEALNEMQDFAPHSR